MRSKRHALIPILALVAIPVALLPADAGPLRNAIAARRIVRPPPPPPASVDGAAAVVALVNRERARAGVPAVTADARLTAAAQAWSAHMSRTNQLSHGDPGARITAAGYRWRAYGENVAPGASAEGVMAMWMNSPGHKRNILNPAMRHAGAGRAGAYWCLVVAAGG